MTPFHAGVRITPAQANFDGNYTYNGAAKGEYRQQTVSVGSFPPNAFGLYEMHGNVWEWCQDEWHEDYRGASSDGASWEDGRIEARVLRGGSWGYHPGYARSATRYGFHPVFRSDSLGFRVLCSSPIDE